MRSQLQSAAPVIAAEMLRLLKDGAPAPDGATLIASWRKHYCNVLSGRAFTSAAVVVVTREPQEAQRLWDRGFTNKSEAFMLGVQGARADTLAKEVARAVTSVASTVWRCPPTDSIEIEVNLWANCNWQVG